MATIADNLQAIRQRIERAARAASRDPATVTLLAVSKTHPSECIDEAHRGGQRAFGENYVQEALEKMQVMQEKRASGLEWHLIGPLQSNKTRLAAEHFDWVQTVGSEKIARRLSEQRPGALSPLNILIQVNVSGEATKAGVTAPEAELLVQKIKGLKNLRVRGLMAIPEPTDEASIQRARFAEVRKIFENLKNGQGQDWDTLSMGMSDDMESAVAEGATMVRIGTAIFGARRRERSAA